MVQSKLLYLWKNTNLTIMETTMSKGYSEALALIEAGKQMALGNLKEKPMRTRTEKKDDKPKEVDLLALLEVKRREIKAIENYIAEQAKLAKPDEKKEEKKKGWNVDYIAMMLLGLMPINWAVIYLLMK